MVIRCGAPAPENIGRCVLTAGHTGRHWNSGGTWNVRPTPKDARPAHGSIDDVRALYRAMTGATLDIARERRAEDQQRRAG